MRGPSLSPEKYNKKTLVVWKIGSSKKKISINSVYTKPVTHCREFVAATFWRTVRMLPTNCQVCNTPQQQVSYDIFVYCDSETTRRSTSNELNIGRFVGAIFGTQSALALSVTHHRSGAASLVETKTKRDLYTGLHLHRNQFITIMYSVHCRRWIVRFLALRQLVDVMCKDL